MAFSDLFDRLAIRSLTSESQQRKKRLSQAKNLRRRRAILETLEERRVLAAFLVSAGGDAGAGTLREALVAANATPEADTITFDSSVTGTITLTAANGALPVTAPVSIEGPGSGVLTINANTGGANEFRVLDIATTAGDVSISGLTLSGGRVPGEAGGAIRFQSDGLLSIQSSVISGNTANNGGGVYSEYAGSIEVSDSTISGNTAMFGPGGGLHNANGNTTLTSSFVTGNRSYNSGGGVFSPYAGLVTITDTELTNNTITEDGYHGAAIYSGEGAVTISGSTISGNTSPGDAGGIYNYNGNFTITDSTVTGNQAGYSGGGLFNYAGAFSITNSSVSNNVSLYGDGGGISNANGGLTLTRSTISGNSAVTDGGGVSNSSGQVIVVGSTLNNNTSGRDGGGIATLTGAVTLTNATVSTNSANVRGGGVKSDSAPVRLVNSTFTLNNANIDGGGIGVLPSNNGESILIHNSIVAGNTSPIGADFIAPGGTGNLEVRSSLIGVNSDTTLAAAQPDSNGNFVGQPIAPENPFLAPLAANGGPTQTHLLSGIGSAIDRGDNALALDFGPDGAPGGGDDVALTSEQRGGLFTRFANTTDMGATEFQAAPTLLVDSADDSENGNLAVGDRSFRELLRIANETAGPDTILFDSLVGPSITIDPALGPLVISDSVTLIGPSPVTLLVIENTSGTPVRLLDITSTAADVSISSIAFAGGDAGNEDGGAIRSQATGTLTINRSFFSGNSAASGGAIALTAGAFEIAATTFDQNTATADGGAISAKAGTTSVQVVDATISGNSAGGSGGGVYSQDAAVTILNSTLTLNDAVTSGGGVGVMADGNGESLNVDNSIIAGNTSGVGADFVAPMTPATNLDVNFSLIGDNADTSLSESMLVNDIPQADSDGNLIGGGANPVIDPLLAALADNGGPTMTHSLMDASLAIDAGDATILPQDTFDLDSDNNRFEFLPVDQRGAVRNMIGGVDMGALELAPAPTITWTEPASISVGTALDNTQLNASSSAAGTFTYTPDTGAILDAGDDQVLTAVFNPADPFAFRSVTATVMIDVTKSDPVITWADPDPISFGTGIDDTQLNATASTPGTFVYDPPSGAILPAGGQTLSVTFTPTDTANFNEVTQTVTLVVNAVDPVLTWGDPAEITFGTVLSATQLDATADTPGTFVYTPAADTILDAGTQTLSVTFTPDNSNFNEVSTTVQIVVAKANPTISWPDPADVGAGTALGIQQLNATADVPGSFVYDPPAGTVLGGGNNQTLMVTFTPTDTDNINVGTATVSINVAVGEDFGDAPTGYPVTLAEDGARHTTGSLTLGSGVDAESDGQPSTAANGDGADEDGVLVIATPVVNTNSDSIASFLVAASEAGQLDAWIDFNGDRDWDDAGEQIATNLTLAVGDNTLSYTVPSSATAGTTAARFRLSSTGGLSPTGAAADGEVEDYNVLLLDGSAAPNPLISLNGDATIEINAQGIAVNDGQNVLFNAPTEGLGSMDVQSGDQDDTVTLDFSDGPGGGLTLNGLGGANTLAVAGSSVDLTSNGLVAAQNFQTVDLTSDGANSVVIDAATVAALSPTDSTINVVGGAGDTVVFNNPTEWRLTDPIVNGNEFIQAATNQLTNEVVRLSLPNAWQNPIETSDVNNNGGVTAGDALVIINELSRRAFSDGTTQDLNNAAGVDPFPGTYYDQNGDGRATALDALRVINRISQLANSGGSDGEEVQALLQHLAASTNSDGSSTLDAPAAIEVVEKLIDAGSSQTDRVTPSVETADQEQGTEVESWANAVDQLLSDDWSLDS
ncbi:MAG: beta strand repeat-containing protein [Rubripirellula sp.]